MSKKIEFLFDFGSPNAYLSWKAVPEIEKRTGTTFTYVPVLLGGIFKAALYLYATRGQAPEGFEGADLARTFTRR